MLWHPTRPLARPCNPASRFNRVLCPRGPHCDPLPHLRAIVRVSGGLRNQSLTFSLCSLEGGSGKPGMPHPGPAPATRGARVCSTTMHALAAARGPLTFRTDSLVFCCFCTGASLESQSASHGQCPPTQCGLCVLSGLSSPMLGASRQSHDHTC